MGPIPSLIPNARNCRPLRKLQPGTAPYPKKLSVLTAPSACVTSQTSVRGGGVPGGVGGGYTWSGSGYTMVGYRVLYPGMLPSWVPVPVPALVPVPILAWVPVPIPAKGYPGPGTGPTEDNPSHRHWLILGRACPLSDLGSPWPGPCGQSLPTSLTRFM